MSTASVQNKIFDFLFYLVVGTLYTFSLSLAVFDATVMEPQTGRLLLLSAGFILLFYILFYNRASTMAAMAAIVLAGSFVFYLLRRAQPEPAWLDRIIQLTRELVLLAREQVPYREAHGDFASLAVTGALAFLAAVNIRVYFSFYLLTALGIVTLGLPIYMDWGKSTGGMLLFLFVFLVLLSKKLNINAFLKTESESGAHQAFSLLAVPACLLITAAAWLLPKPLPTDDPSASPQGTTPQLLLDAAESLLSGFGASTAGTYTEEGERLGGPSYLPDRAVMTVWSDEPVYLSSSVRDTYTGASWSTDSGGITALEADADGVYPVSEYVEEDARQSYYMRFYGRSQQTVTVEPTGRTRVLYTPPFQTGLRFPDGDYTGSLAANPYGVLSAERAVSRGTRYEVTHYSWDYQNTYFTSMLQGLDTSYRGDLDLFLALPETLPDRVTELAAEITAGYSDSYTKLKALEAYLAAFPYTLEPESVPRGEDFVDYFLFTGREGYCVYYASALAVMGRCAGIPTRYVEGYILPSAQNEDGSYTVTGKQAHAWAEAYFDGFGWVPIEATPIYAGGLYTGEEGVLTEPATDWSQDEAATQRPDTDTDERTNPTSPSLTEPDGAVKGDAGGIRPLPVLLALLFLLLLGGGVLALVGAAGRKKQAALEHLPNRESTEAYFFQILRAASAFGYPIRKNETAHAYAGRVGPALQLGDGAVALEELADIFARASYSRDAISDADCQIMKNAYFKLLDAIKRESRGPQYYLYRYVLGRF